MVSCQERTPFEPQLKDVTQENNGNNVAPENVGAVNIMPENVRNNNVMKEIVRADSGKPENTQEDNNSKLEKRPPPSYEESSKLSVRPDHHSSATEEGLHVSAARIDYGSIRKVSVCPSCQHLHGRDSEVVLSPSHLDAHPAHTHTTTQVFRDRPSVHPVLSPPTGTNVTAALRPWTTRGYEGLCECGASVGGGVCVCRARATAVVRRELPLCATHCCKKVKVVALVLAALLPWVFLVTYIVLSTT